MRISGFTFIKFRVKGIEVFGVQLILDNTESFAKTLEMYDFPGAKELYGFIAVSYTHLCVPSLHSGRRNGKCKRY